MLRRFLSILLIMLFLSAAVPVFADTPDNIPFEVNAESAVLMEYETGRVLYAKNADRAMPPASVTKIMTLLLFMEEVDAGNISLDETLTVSEYAASMGGSQGEPSRCWYAASCQVIVVTTVDGTPILPAGPGPR